MPKYRKYSEKTSLEFNEVTETIFFPIYPVITNQILKKADVDAGSCLDVGCGPGHLAISLAALSELKVFAMDNSRPMCRIAKNNVKKYRMERRIRPAFGGCFTNPQLSKRGDLNRHQNN